MTRFSNLEFEDDHQQEQQSAPGTAAASAHRVITDDVHYIGLGDEKYMLGFFEEALKVYSRALSHNPNNLQGWVGQLRMLLELGELKEARLWSQKSLEIFRDNPDLLSLQGVSYCRLGDKKKAIEFSDAAFAQQGAGSLYMWLARGEVLLALRGKQADFALEKAASMQGFAEWFRLLLVARTYYFHRHYTRAMQKAREAIELKPTSPFAWHVLGNCQEAMRQFKKAEQSYRDAMVLFPDRDYPPSKAALSTLGNLGLMKRLFTFG
jgi:tetratricopeptide (TPR) repeat protein